MSTVRLIDGRIVEHVQLTNIQHVGDEGSRTATAHIDGKEYAVYNSIVDGFNSVWTEQITWETYQLLKGSVDHGFVEGSTSDLNDK
jgi:hypothetical protein